MDTTSAEYYSKQITAPNQSVETRSVLFNNQSVIGNVGTSAINDSTEHQFLIPGISADQGSLEDANKTLRTSSAYNGNMNKVHNGDTMQVGLKCKESETMNICSGSNAAPLSSLSGSNLNLQDAMQVAGSMEGLQEDWSHSPRLPQRLLSQYSSHKTSVCPQLISSPTNTEGQMPPALDYDHSRQNYSYYPKRNKSQESATLSVASNSIMFPSTIVKDPIIKQIGDVPDEQSLPCVSVGNGVSCQLPGASNPVITPQTSIINNSVASTSYCDDGIKPIYGYKSYSAEGTASVAGKNQAITVSSKYQDVLKPNNFTMPGYSPDDSKNLQDSFYTNRTHYGPAQIPINSRSWQDYENSCENESVVQTYQQDMSTSDRSQEYYRPTSCVKDTTTICYCSNCYLTFNSGQLDDHIYDPTTSCWNNVPLTKRSYTDSRNIAVTPDMYDVQNQHPSYLSDGYGMNFRNDCWNASNGRNFHLQSPPNYHLGNNYAPNNSQQQNQMLSSWKGNVMVRSNNNCNKNNFTEDTNNWSNGRDCWKNREQDNANLVAKNHYQTHPGVDSLYDVKNSNSFYPNAPVSQKKVDVSNPEFEYSWYPMTAPSQTSMRNNPPSCSLQGLPGKSNFPHEWQLSNDKYEYYQHNINKPFNPSNKASAGQARPPSSNSASPQNEWFNESFGPATASPASAVCKVPQSAGNTSLPVVSRREEFEVSEGIHIDCQLARRSSAPSWWRMNCYDGGSLGNAWTAPSQAYGANLESSLTEANRTNKSINRETSGYKRSDQNAMRDMTDMISSNHFSAAACVDQEHNIGSFGTPLAYSETASKISNFSKPCVSSDNLPSMFTAKHDVGKITDSTEVKYAEVSMTLGNVGGHEDFSAATLKDSSDISKPSNTDDQSKDLISSSDISTNRKPAAKRRRYKLNVTQTSILEYWYEMRKSHPYPNGETVKYLAQAVGISGAQVVKWLSNKRIREGNTKSMADIVRYRSELKQKVTKKFEKK